MQKNQRLYSWDEYYYSRTNAKRGFRFDTLSIYYEKKVLLDYDCLETLYDYEKWDLCSRRCNHFVFFSICQIFVFCLFLGLKLGKDFYNSHKEKFNISKVPDIYDSIKYDLLHNKDMIQYPQAKDLYLCSKALADIVVPQVRRNQLNQIYNRSSF